MAATVPLGTGPYLGAISGPADLRSVPLEFLPVLAGEIRDFLVEKVRAAGGHLGPNLGVVELTPALHRVFEMPRDIVLFDTGHQTTAFAILLHEGIGDTIRVSLTAPPVEEVTAGCQILESLGLRTRRLEIVSCPSCGRAQVDVYALTARVQAAFEGFPHPLRVAVMGCVVNGPGEAREADLGVSSGNGKGQIFVRGEVIRTVPESRIVETLIEEALRLTEGMETPSTEPPGTDTADEENEGRDAP